jgi:spermidine synthase
MQAGYEELDFRATALGDLVLRRRLVPGLGDEAVYEIMLGDDLLMSSYLNESEVVLAQAAIPAAGDGVFDVLVGGLGLGYTASAALGFERVRSVTVIELLPEVIEWHVQGLVPLGQALTNDTRLEIVHGDFFQLVGACNASLRARAPDGFGAILVDIDHAPDSWLTGQHGAFYAEAPLARAATLLREGGVFALWSAGAVNADFVACLSQVFPDVETRAIEVFNPMIDEGQVDTIYLARKASAASS